MTTAANNATTATSTPSAVVIRSSVGLGDGQTTNLCADDARVACPLFQAEYGGSRPTSALQLKIVKVSHRTAEQLNGKWHSKMPKIGMAGCCEPCFAAVCNNIYYAIAMWSRPVAANRIKDGEQCLELRRMAIADDAPENTASRMLRVMKDTIRRERPDILRLISYQDTEVHKGTIYKAAGWNAALVSEYRAWTNANGRRPQKSVQSEAAKVRWEYTLRESPNCPF